MNVQEGGCFSNSRRVDDVTRAMSKGGACECPRGGCFSNSRRVDDVTRAMSKGGVLVNVQEGGVGRVGASRGQCPRGGCL